MKTSYLAKLFFTIFILFSCISVKFYAQVYDDKNFDQALNYLMKANYDSSILVLDKIISNDPSNLLANSFKSYI